MWGQFMFLLLLTRCSDLVEDSIYGYDPCAFAKLGVRNPPDETKEKTKLSICLNPTEF